MQRVAHRRCRTFDTFRSGVIGRSSVSGVPSTSSIVARMGGRSLYAWISSTDGTKPDGPEFRMPSRRRNVYRA
jgi:hypothetical protein